MTLASHPVLVLLLSALAVTGLSAVEAQVPPETAVPPSAWQARAETQQWAKARLALMLPDGRQAELVRTLRVTEAKADAQGRHATVEVTTEHAGNKEIAVERYVVSATAPAEAVREEKDLGQQTLTLGGTKLACRATERTTVGPPPVSIRTWTSDQVPLGGTVRIEHDGKVVFELLDYGPK